MSPTGFIGVVVTERDGCRITMMELDDVMG